jgi:hypothetical protein
MYASPKIFEAENPPSKWGKYYIRVGRTDKQIFNVKMGEVYQIIIKEVISTDPIEDYVPYVLESNVVPDNFVLKQEGAEYYDRSVTGKIYPLNSSFFRNDVGGVVDESCIVITLSGTVDFNVNRGENTEPAPGIEYDGTRGGTQDWGDFNGISTMRKEVWSRYPLPEEARVDPE